MGKGGGGGGSQPTQTTAYQTNLPEYAQPYVMSMLGATQNQLFNTSGSGPDATITGFKPYQPYSSDPTKYFAGPTGLQTSVYNEAAGMQTPGGYQPAQALTGLAALGQMGAGQQYAQQATTPSSIQAYMSPYMQNVVDVQKANAIRDYQMGIPALRKQASAAGAFGGSRQAIQESEAQRSLLSNLANIQAQGSQNAFQQAQQAQQFGANLGLQGLGAAVSSAGQLGSLAGAQQQADLARMGFQQQTGAAQQQYQQNIINQAIQDYATAQQYPLMQLGFMSNMLRGLPMQATTTQSYMPTPNLTTQAIAGLGTAAGAYKAFGFKEGGAVPGYAGPEGSVVNSMRAKLEALADSPGGVQQVAQIAQTSPSQEMRALANEVLMEKQMEERAAQQAEQSIQQDQAMGRGLAAAPAPVMDTLAAAGGGIIAFADEGEVEYDPNKVYQDPYQVLSDAEAFAREKGRREALGIGEAISPEYREFLTKRKEALGKQSESDVGLNMIDFFSRMNKPGSTLTAATAAAGESLPGIIARRKEAAARESEIAKGEQDIYGKERAEKVGILGAATKGQEESLKRRSEREKAKISNFQRTTDLMQVFGVELANLGAEGKDVNDPKVRKLAMDNAQRVFGGKGAAQETRDLAAFTTAKDKDEKIGVKGTLTKQLNLLKLKTPPKDQDKLAAHNKAIEDLEDQIAQRELVLERRYLKKQSGGSQKVINLDNQN